MDKVIKQYIMDISSTLSAGQSSGHEYCPLCKGGSHRERSFIVRPLGRDAVFYKCYRATCGMGSGIMTSGGAVFVKQEKEFKPRPYTYATQSLSDEELQFFRRKYELTPAELETNGVKRVPLRNSYVFPIYNNLGYEIGTVDRAFWDRKPKSLTYWFKDQIKLHFPQSVIEDKGSTLLVVEDQLSAIKGNRFMHSCALLGTEITLDMAMYLAERYPNILLALDKDASAKAIQYRMKYGLLFRNFNTLLLSKDIKDTLHVELEEMLDERKES